MSVEKFHRYDVDVSDIEPPRRFTYPFYYTAHPLAVKAARQTLRHIAGDAPLASALSEGKMLGVLVARDSGGKMGFLAAFSGNVGGTNRMPYFVPPIYDLLNPEGEFKQGENRLNEMNRLISAKEDSAEIAEMTAMVGAIKERGERRIADYKAFITAAKARRDAIRAIGNVPQEKEVELIAESQFHKAEFKRIKRQVAGEQEAALEQLSHLTAPIARLKEERRRFSEYLQRRIFELFVVRNARGEERDLLSIFTSEGKIPPAGAGECAAPKLLQYAYLNELHPLCMAEFWVGASPTAEIRHHGNFYPSCRGKCLPILSFMLQGLDVDPNPLSQDCGAPLKVLWEDDYLIAVDKPSGLASVEGKAHTDSVITRLRTLFPPEVTPLAVHRLDMATSGILLVAKDLTTQKTLQRQFERREVKKEYIAVVCGEVSADSGTIDLPLRPDLLDRPRQVVDLSEGKAAVTHFTVLERRDGTTLLLLVPEQGRTHQLRVHCAHPQGLNAPIKGDPLYGAGDGSRLHLHATRLTFVHPVTGKRLTIVSSPRKGDSIE